MSKQKIRDKKEIIIAMREAGKSRREITENRGLTKEQVKNWENRYSRRIQNANGTSVKKRYAYR